MHAPSFMAVIFVLLVAALVLWVLSQFPLDPTITKIIRALIIVGACLYALLWLFTAFSGAFGGGGRPLRL